MPVRGRSDDPIGDANRIVDEAIIEAERRGNLDPEDVLAEWFVDARAALNARADALSALLDKAFDALLWISEAPNRVYDLDDDALVLAKHARVAWVEIERCDPDKDWTGP